VLGGVVLILVADAVGLVDGVDVWPLVTLAVVLAAVASVALVLGYRSRAEDLLRTVAAPWFADNRFDRMEAKLDELMAARDVERRERGPESSP
jgi:hypothetical protein